MIQIKQGVIPNIERFIELLNDKDFTVSEDGVYLEFTKTQKEIDAVLKKLESKTEQSVFLDKQKEIAKNTIDSLYTKKRKELYTNQSLVTVYQEKAKEAQAYKANGYPADLTEYPYIKAEVEAKGLTAKEVCNSILAKVAEANESMAQLEAGRFKAKIAIDSTTTVKVLNKELKKLSTN